MKARLSGGFVAAWVITAAVVLFCANAALADCGRGHHGKGQGKPAFTDVDTNGDGVIVSDELYAMQARRMAARAEAGGKMKRAGHRPTFEDIDTDGDGEITPDEFAAHQASRHGYRKGQQT